MSWIALALAAMATSCALTKRDDISDLPFDCWQGTECRCTVQDPYGQPTPKEGRWVRACEESFDCCLLDEARDATSLRRCICYETDASCEEMDCRNQDGGRAPMPARRAGATSGTHMPRSRVKSAGPNT